MPDEQLFLEPDDLPPVDRSTLDNTAECPRMSRFIETGRVQHAKFCMVSGNACHEAIGETIDEYVASQGAMSVPDVSEFLLQRASAARPDLQPDVIKGLRASAWGLAKYLHGLHHMNILRWDGGKGEHSGQLSADFADLGVRVTSEIDLLHAGPSPEVIHEVDFKSGHERWTADKVADDFQFNLHAWLGLKNYPDVKAVQIRIWDTRFNKVTYAVPFDRANFYHYDFRVHSAAEAYVRFRNSAPEDTTPYPTVEKCADCPAAAMCDCTRLPQETPDQIVDKLVGLEAQAAALHKLATEHVRRSGLDILTASGNAFGTGKPTKARAATMKLYEIKAAPDPEAEGEP